MRNICLVVAYEGTAYRGFQIQKGGRTIQGELEKALGGIFGHAPRVMAAGRTDAGVHALGQVVNFRAEGSIPTDRIPRALNGLLPPDIVVRGAAEVPPSFHARYDATGKTYRYLIYTGGIPSPFWRRYSLMAGRSLDLAAMQQAAAFLVGTHDFRSFQASGSSVKRTVRTVSDISIREVPPLVIFEARADGFLYKMVRNIVGTCLEIGLGAMKPEDIREVLVRADRDAAGPTAPPEGLFLVRVDYPPDRLPDWKPGPDGGMPDPFLS